MWHQPIEHYDFDRVIRPKRDKSLMKGFFHEPSTERNLRDHETVIKLIYWLTPILSQITFYARLMIKAALIISGSNQINFWFSKRRPEELNTNACNIVASDFPRRARSEERTFWALLIESEGNDMISQSSHPYAID